MEKDNDTKIFMMCHRHIDYNLIDNRFITPIQCGAEMSSIDVCDLKDNTGDNISKDNYFFLENTAIYWIWKNVTDCKYKGQTQYRRRLDIGDITDYDSIFKTYDIIVAEPLDLNNFYDYENCTLELQYAIAHNIRDLQCIERIIMSNFQDYYEDYVKYIKNGTIIYYSNGFVMKSDDYDDYCKFLFNILNIWKHNMDAESFDDLKMYVSKSIETGLISNSTMKQDEPLEHKINYQMRIGGSLSERLFTLYVLHNFKNIYTVKYIKEEGLVI